MLESKNTQFSLSSEGKILWQEKLNNPVPGVEVAILEKGLQPLKPIVNIIESDLTSKYNTQELNNRLNLWLSDYLKEVIEPLILLEVPHGAGVKDNAVSKIVAKMYEGMGIVPREKLEDLIAELTPEDRTELRAKKIRLGPVLAFMPDLNKPAAVRLRALLLSIYNGYDLPPKVPADGIVSAKIEGNADPAYYRAIGYPLYGGRAVRIDMLDRVISCVYDHADKGKFQARHEMAEWLGCSIEDLYKVLESMGHTKIYDPAEQEDKEKEEASEGKTELDKKESEDNASVSVSEEKSKVNEKPELATFRLKKGKAFASKQSETGKKSITKGKGKAQSKVSPKKTYNKKDKKGNGKKESPRVISAQAKVSADDSPFAILQQLKK